jgi:competence CoiA-like predicted nuclease
MQFAIINGERVRPQKGLRGACQNCGGVLIAKCGNYVIHHWAHLTRKHCDSWWEPETEWHRAWKNNFPDNFQEAILFNPETGEKHIADLKSDNGNIVEFQHSPIAEEERLSREDFYLKFGKNMTWVLDCSDRSLNFMFHQGFIHDTSFEYGVDKTIIWMGRQKLFEKWSVSKAYVLLDFGYETLWWLRAYDAFKKEIIVNARHKNVFIRKIKGE